MASSVRNWISFRGDDGLVVLQSAEEINTILMQHRKATGHRGAYTAIYLLLRNNNKIEVFGETVKSVFDKLEAAFGSRPVLYGDDGAIRETEVKPPIPEEA